MKIPGLDNNAKAIAFFSAFVAIVATFYLFTRPQPVEDERDFSASKEELLTFYCKHIELIARLAADVSCGAQAFGECVSENFSSLLKAYCADPSRKALGHQALDVSTTGMEARVSLAVLAQNAGCIK